MIIYIAGQYSAKTDEERQTNVNKAIESSVGVIIRGHVPIIPHLTHYMDKIYRKMGVELEYKDYIKIGIAILRRCDALFVISNSEGVSQEIQEAVRMGMRIYRDVNDIPYATK